MSTHLRVSARNQLRGTVTAVTEGEAIANVAVDVGGQHLMSSVTRDAVQELGIAVGSEVVLLIKASDVLLGVE